MKKHLAKCISALLCCTLLLHAPAELAFAAPQGSGPGSPWEEATADLGEIPEAAELETESEATETETEEESEASGTETEEESEAAATETEQTESEISITEEDPEWGEGLPEGGVWISEEEFADDPQAWKEYYDSLEEDAISLQSLSSQNYIHDSRFNGYTIVDGIDVSKHQGTIDWAKVKAAGAEFVMIRAGYRGYTSGAITKDERFDENVRGAIGAGLRVGVYFFSQAVTEAEAIAEADYVLSLVRGYNINMPVAMDFEYASGSNGSTGRLYDAKLSNQAATGIVNNFCNRIQTSGYTPMVYANENMLNQHLNMASVADKYYVWLAHYTTQTNYQGDYNFWQYSSKGNVNGIDGNVDLNFWYYSGSFGSMEKLEKVDCIRNRNYNREGGFNAGHYSPSPANAFGSAAEQTIAQRAIAALSKGEKSFSISDLDLNVKNQNQMSAIDNTMFMLFDTNYQYFYVNYYGYEYNSVNGAVKSIYFNYVPSYCNADGSLNQGVINNETALYDMLINEALSCISPQMDNVEKALALHDYLVINCDFDAANYINRSIPALSYSILGALSVGSAVSQGYAATYSTLLRKAGIDSYVVASASMNHAWNLVSINGAWYHVDVSKDDPMWLYGTTSQGKRNNDYADEGYVSHDYFLKSDAEMSGYYGYAGPVPAATNSNAFIGYFFYGMNQKMSYYDTFWYCLNSANAAPTNIVKKGKINGTSSDILSLVNVANYAFVENGVIYYSTSSGVYTRDLRNGREELYADISSEYPGYELTEFTRKNQQFTGVLYNSATSDFTRAAFDSAVRVYGQSRYETAISAAEILRKGGRFSAVVIANADNFPDALSGSTLAVQNHAPILLVGKSREGTQKTIEYIAKYVDKTGKIYLLGGEGAVSRDVEYSLGMAGFSYSNIVRLGGNSRYDTNLRIVEAMSVQTGTDIFIASGTNYADSLSVSAVAGIRNMPIFLTGNSMSNATMDAIRKIAPGHIYIIGGTGAVGEGVESQARGLCSSVERIWGPSRYDTSVAVANRFNMGNSDAAVFAFGGNFPDGLAGGVLAASLNAPVILVSDNNYTNQEYFLRYSRISKTYIMGGSAVISNNTMQHLKK